MSRPIVFLPGVMGSRLYFPNADRFWDPDSQWRMLRWAPIRFVRSDDDNCRDMHVREPAGVVLDPLDELDADRVSRGWGGVVWSFYKDYLGLLEGLAENGQAFALGYDWRADIRDLGVLIAERLRLCLAVTGADKLWAATHSMGGLVFRAALKAAPDLANSIERVVHVCQPSVGAVVLYRRLFTGLVRPFDGGGKVADRAFRFILGNSRAGFVGNMSGQPGPVQLLPSRFLLADPPWAAALDDGSDFAGLYPNAESPPGLLDPELDLSPEVADDLRARIADVAGFQDELGDPTAPGPDTWLLYGSGVDTETRIEFAGRTATPRLTPDGDGVVPRASARALGLPADRMIPIDGLVHAEACQHPLVHQATADVFQ
jgi:hypothetical protein